MDKKSKPENHKTIRIFISIVLVLVVGLIFLLFYQSTSKIVRRYFVSPDSALLFQTQKFYGKESWDSTLIFGYKALSYYQEAAPKNPYFLAKIYGFIGGAYLKKDMLDSAELNTLSSLILFERLEGKEHKMRIVAQLNNLSSNARRNEDHLQGIELNTRALRLLDSLEESAESSQFRTTLLSNQAACYLGIKNWWKAIEVADKTQKIYGKSGMDALIYTFYYTRGVAYKNLGEYNRAILQFDTASLFRSTEKGENVQTRLELIQTRTWLAKSLDMPSKAFLKFIAELQQIRDATKGLSELEFYARSMFYEVSAETYEYCGDTKMALNEQKALVEETKLRADDIKHKAVKNAHHEALRRMAYKRQLEFDEDQRTSEQLLHLIILILGSGSVVWAIMRIPYTRKKIPNDFKDAVLGISLILFIEGLAMTTHYTLHEIFHLRTVLIFTALVVIAGSIHFLEENLKTTIQLIFAYGKSLFSKEEKKGRRK